MMRHSMPPLHLTIEAVETPIGGLFLVCDDRGVLRAADFVDCEARMHRLLERRLGTGSYTLTEGAAGDDLKHAITRYFEGNIAAITSIAVTSSGSQFQEEVWTALRGIQPGRPATYAELAGILGRANAARAIGHANAANPLCIVVPCHRLLGANGGLTGYSGGVERKRWLLDHEARHRR